MRGAGFCGVAAAFAAVVLGAWPGVVAWAQTDSGDSVWVASWGTAQPLAVEVLPDWVEPPPADQLPPDPPPSPIPAFPRAFEDQTVRMLVRPSLGGERLRLQFSNAKGTQPVRLGAVSVAPAERGPSIDAARSRGVRFGGRDSITLYPGGLVVSDPIALEVQPLGELAVSVYLPDRSDTATVHELGLNTTRVADGDRTGQPTLPETGRGSGTNRSYFWLTGMEVETGPDAGTIVAFGDSITDGYATTANAHRAWPELLADRLARTEATAHLGVINMGISGNRVLQDGAGASALARFDRDVLARSGVRWIVLLEGINDITWSALPRAPEANRVTAAQIIEGLSQLVDRAHARGIRVMGATLTPMAGLWLFNEQTESMRREVNDWVRTSGKYDAVVDFDAVTRDPQSPERLRPDHDSGDHIHPNDAGNAAMAEAIDIAVFSR